MSYSMISPSSQSSRHISVLLVDPDKDYALKAQSLLFTHYSESLDLTVIHSLHDGIAHLCTHPVRLILMGPVFSDHRVSDAVKALRLAAPSSAFLVYDGVTPGESFLLDALRAGAHEVTDISDITPNTFHLAIERALARTWQSATAGTTVPVAPKVIHDLNNAVTAINGFGDILLTHFQADSRNRVCIEQITKAGARAAALLKTLSPHTARTTIPQCEDEHCASHSG
ncbi:MAG: hypothetical protein OEY86_01205 [Nitrospira sp.]|nr:hypothetical protein [Nitrospira sp.]